MYSNEVITAIIIGLISDLSYSAVPSLSTDKNPESLALTDDVETV